MPTSAVTVLSASAAVLLGVAVLAGWHFGLDVLTRILPRFPVLQYNAALALLLSGAGMLLAVFDRRWPAVLCGAGIGVLGLATLAEYAFRIDLGIDQLVVPDGNPDVTGHPGRMATEVALCLVLTGAAVGIMPQRRTFKQRPLLLILLGAMIFGLGITGFVGAAAPFHSTDAWIRLPKIALHAACGFMAVGVGITDFGWRQRWRGEVQVRDLRNSIIIYTTFGMLLMTVVSALLAVLPIYDQLREAQHSFLLHATRSKANGVEQYLLRVEAVALQITSRTRARRLLESYSRGELSREEFVSQSKPILNDALAGFREARGIARLDRRGEPLVDVGVAVPRELWPQQIPDIDAPVVNGPVVHCGDLYLVVAAPVLDRDNRRIGADMVLVQCMEIGRILAGRSGLDIDARLVLRGSAERGRPALVWDARHRRVALTSPGADFEEVARLASRAADGLMEPNPAAATSVLRAYAPVQGTDWFILATIEANKLYYPVNRQLVLVLAVVGALALLGAMAIYLLLRPLTGTMLIHTDLLEKRIRDATEALAKSEERFDLAVRGTDAGIWDWNLETDRVYFSPRWKSMLGYAEDEIADNYWEWERRLHPDDHGRAIEAVRAYQNGETPQYELEHRLRHKDGSYRWILARGTLLRDAEGRPIRMVGSHIDVTDRKLAEERLKGMAAALEQSNRDLEQFAYVASHDLQEPLRMMSSYLQALTRQYRENLPPNAQSLVDLSLASGRRMQQLINDLLAYSRVQTRPVRFRPVDCNEVFEHAVENLKLAIEESSAQITSRRLPTVIGDYTQLVQLFQNLIGNAIKFRSEHPPCVHVSADRAREQWTIAVRDNGIGIPSEHSETVFEVFQRLHSGDEYPGTGIGLAVCKRIVDRHGGKIWFESELDRGTTFLFTLPSAETQENNGNEGGVANQSGRNHERVGDEAP
ncbi:MAG: PAS domain-containing protein [Pirellulales bacterium]|nr:PAS domain-containing protein [Pirellulales bacterium]